MSDKLILTPLTNATEARRIPFPSVAALDVWFEPAKGKSGNRTVHVDVTFGMGREGGEEQSKVTFRMRLKRANVQIGNPNSIDTPKLISESVKRKFAEELKLTEKLTVRKESKASGGLFGKIGFTKKGPALTGEVSAGVSSAEKIGGDLTATAKRREMTVTHAAASQDHVHTYAILQTLGGPLEGKPWDAKKEPLAKLNCTEGKRIPDVMVVTIRALWDDVEIVDIIWKKATDNLNPYPLAKRLAAREHIKHQIARLGLGAGDPHSNFAEIVLAQVMVEVT